MKNRKIPYVIYHEAWDPLQDKDIRRLRKEGRRVYLNQFEASVADLKRYFCPCCGFFCKRTPREITPQTTSVYFSHRGTVNGPKRPKCIFGKSLYVSKNNTEQKKRRAEINEELIRIRYWADSLQKGIESDKKKGRSDLLGDTIPEDINFQEEENRYPSVTPLKITSLQTIVDNISDNYYKEIELPGFDTPKAFLDVIFHASEIAEESRYGERIFWGKVLQPPQQMGEYTRVSFGYSTHCLFLALKNSILQSKKINFADLEGLTVAFAGLLGSAKPQSQNDENKFGSARKCYMVAVKRAGAFAVVDESLLNEFPEVDAHEPINAIPLDIEIINSGNVSSSEQNKNNRDDKISPKEEIKVLDTNTEETLASNINTEESLAVTSGLKKEELTSSSPVQRKTVNRATRPFRKAVRDAVSIIEESFGRLIGAVYNFLKTLWS